MKYNDFYAKKIREFKSSIENYSSSRSLKLNTGIKNLGLVQKLKELNKEKECSSNDDSIIIDQDSKFVSFNFKMRDFEKDINKKSNYDFH